MIKSIGADKEQQFHKNSVLENKIKTKEMRFISIYSMIF